MLVLKMTVYNRSFFFVNIEQPTMTSNGIITKSTPSEESTPTENLWRGSRILLISWWSFSLVFSEVADEYGEGQELPNDRDNHPEDDESEDEPEPEFL